jgi:hypothetical protein
VALASHPSASAAVAAFVDRFRPSEYNPGWLAVADRQRLFTIDMTAGDRPEVVERAAGVHVFENRPPGTDSAKVRRVRCLLEGLAELPDDVVAARVRAALSSHEGDPERARAPGSGGSSEQVMPAEPCVHGDRYGTRWSAVVSVGRSPGPPVFQYADGPPCSTPFTDAALWPLP